MPEARNTLDGTRISYEDTGEGQTVVLAHGSLLSRVIWRGFGYTKPLKENYRVIALDLRGHGRSDKPHHSDDYRMELLVADILAVLDTAGVYGAHYFGYSLGARVGFAMADQASDRVLSLISVGGGASTPPGSVANLFFPGFDEALESGGMEEFVRRWDEATGRPIDPQTRLAMLANDPVAMRALFGRLEHEPGVPDARLAHIDAPALLLAGSEDPERRTASIAAAAVMPNAEFHELPGRGHGDSLRPAGPVLDLVLPFLRAAQAG